MTELVKDQMLEDEMVKDEMVEDEVGINIFFLIVSDTLFLTQNKFQIDQSFYR